MAKGVIRVRITGDERELTGSLRRAHTEVNKFSGGVSGAIKGLALLGGGAALVGGFTKAIDQTVQWGSEVKSLTRNLGISSQQASGLALAAEHYGLGVDQLSKGLGIFEKHIVAGDKAAQSLGITFKDNKGQLLPFNTILEKTSGIFQKLPDGPQKTALALNLFGRSGKDLIPFLNAGPKAMQQFSAEAKKLGLSLSGDNLRTITNYKFATRDFTASLHGLEVQIGLRVLPVLTTFAHIAATGVELLGKIPTPVLGAAAAFGTFVLAVSLASRFASAAQDAFASLGSGLSDLFGGAEQASAGLRAEGGAASQGIAANTAAATAASRLALANDALAGATDQSSVATEIARVQALKDATAQTIAAAASTRATIAAEAQAAANITLGESALAASIGLQKQAVAATEASAAYSAGGLRGALSGILAGFGSVISKAGPAVLSIGAIGSALVLQARAAHTAAKEAETFANAFAAAAGTGPTGIAKIKDEIASLQTELNKASRLTGGRNLFQALTFWRPSDKDRLKDQIKDLKAILKDLDVAAEAGGTAVDKINASFEGTATFQDNLKRLVAEGVPQKIADQLKTMGQDGQDAAQELADGTDEARQHFIDLANKTLPYVEPKLRQFFGMTRTEFKSWTDGLRSGFNFIQSDLSSLASTLSDTTLSNALTKASKAATSAKNAESTASSRLAVFEAQLHGKKTITAADLLKEQQLQDALATAQGRGKTAANNLATAQDAVSKSAQAVLTAFDDELKAQREYTRNFERLLARHLPADFVKQLADMGAQGAPLVAALASANKTQFNKIVSDWQTAAKDSRILSTRIYNNFNRGSITIPIKFKVDLAAVRKAFGAIPGLAGGGVARYSFAEGGLIPGTPGQKVPIIAHAGEYVLTRQETMRAQAYAQQVSGRSGGSIPSSMLAMLYQRRESRPASQIQNTQTYIDNSTWHIHNPLAEPASHSIPAVRRRQQILLGR